MSWTTRSCHSWPAHHVPRLNAKAENHKCDSSNLWDLKGMLLTWRMCCLHATRRFYYHASRTDWDTELKSPTLWALTASTGACSSPQMTVTTSLCKHNAGDAEVNVETTLPFVLHALQGIFSSFARYWAQSATAKSTVRQPSLAKTNHTICKHHHWFCKKLQVPSWI